MRIKIIILLLISITLLGISQSIYSHEETWINMRSMIVESASSVLIEKGKSKDTYAAWKVIDGDSETAWVEGKKDEGNGEFLIFGYGYVGDYIEILPGFAKNEKYFKINNRPKDICVIIIKFNEIFDVKKLTDLTNPKIQIIKEYNFQLQDIMKFQRFEMTNVDKVYDSFRGPADKYKMIIAIKSVYRGSRDNDTCISEIHFIKKSDGEDIIKAIRDNYLTRGR